MKLEDAKMGQDIAPQMLTPEERKKLYDAEIGKIHREDVTDPNYGSQTRCQQCGYTREEHTAYGLDHEYIAKEES